MDVFQPDFRRKATFLDAFRLLIHLFLGNNIRVITDAARTQKSPKFLLTLRAVMPTELRVTLAKAVLLAKAIAITVFWTRPPRPGVLLAEDRPHRDGLVVIVQNSEVPIAAIWQDFLHADGRGRGCRPLDDAAVLGHHVDPVEVRYGGRGLSPAVDGHGGHLAVDDGQVHLEVCVLGRDEQLGQPHFQGLD